MLYGKGVHVSEMFRREDRVGEGLTAVLRGLGETAASGAVVGSCDVVAVDDQRAAEEVVVLAEGAVWCAGVHVRESALHVVVREHADTFDAEGLEDVLLEVVVQRHAGYSLDDCACPINVCLSRYWSSVHRLVESVKPGGSS